MRYDESPDRASCPVCERDCGVLEKFRQATRTEPVRSLGRQGYCPDCELTFAVSHVQTTLPVVGD